MEFTEINTIILKYISGNKIKDEIIKVGVIGSWL